MTNSKWFGNSDGDPVADLMRRINAAENYINDLERKIANFDSPQPLSRVDPLTYKNPYEGQRAIDPADEQHMWYSNNQWRKAAGGVTLFIKVFGDNLVVSSGDGKFIFACSDDMDGMNLVDADAFITTVSSSGIVTVQIRNITQAADMLSTRITIDVGEFTSYSAATAPAIDTGNDDVAMADRIAIDVDVAGTGAKGLGVILAFS